MLVAAAGEAAVIALASGYSSGGSGGISHSSGGSGSVWGKLRKMVYCLRVLKMELFVSLHGLHILQLQGGRRENGKMAKWQTIFNYRTLESVTDAQVHSAALHGRN